MSRATVIAFFTVPRLERALTLALLTLPAVALAAPEPLPAPNLRLFAPAAVTDIEPVADGSIIVLGEFTAVYDAPSGLVVPRPRIAKFDASGELDLAWNPAPDAAGTIRGIELAADGSALYVWGSFSQLGGVAYDSEGTRLARVAVTGTGAADVSWVPASLRGGSGASFVTDVQEAGGDVWVAGSFTSDGAGTTLTRLARLDRTTAVADPTFAPAPNAPVLALTPGAGTVYVSGNFTTIAGATQPYLARFDAASGAFATTWRPTVATPIGATAVASDDTLYGAQALGGQVVRVVPAGTATPNFFGSSSVLALTVGSDGAIYAGGFFIHFDATTDHVARYNAAGQLDPMFRAGADRPARALAVDANGSLVAGGDFTTLFGTRALGLARLTAGLALDRAWDALKPGDVRAIAPAADGGTFIGGNFAYVDDLLRLGVAKLSPSLDVDPTWAAADARIANSLLVVDGQVIVSSFDRPLRRYSVAAPATLDSAWQPVPLPNPSLLAAHDGWLYYDSGFSGPQAGIKRVSLAGTGATDAAWSANATVEGMTARGLRALVIDVANERIYAGGTFVTAGGQPRTNLARFSLATGAVDAWAPVANANVTAIVPFGAHVYIGGTFTQFEGTPATGLVRVARDPLATSTPDPAFLPVLPPAQLPNALLATDAALFTGTFRVRYDGSVDASWQGPQRVAALETHADGVLIGGSFVQAGTQARTALALLPPIVDAMFRDGFETPAP